jgi:hypothetical protein
MQVKAKESKNKRETTPKTRKGKTHRFPPQGQGKRRETSFVARKLYYNSKLLSFLEALDLYNERSRLTMLFQVIKLN